MEPIRIALTGGPCGGKTSALPYLKKRLTDIGYNVVTSPESATLLHGFGFDLIPSTNDDYNVARQVAMINTLLALEDAMAVMHHTSPKPTILLSDRGAMDAKAYTPPHLWDKVLKAGNWNETLLREGRYSAVFHLVSAAVGTDFYTKANNEARFETAEQAIAADLRTQQVWVGHPHLRMVDNSTEFDPKLDRLFAKIRNFLDHKEIERRFLVKPDSAIDLFGIKALGTFISQTYLTSDSTSIRRVRKRRPESFGGMPICYLTTKSRNPGIVRDEYEEVISYERYNTLLNEADANRERIDKVRWYFIWNNRQYELDVFEWYNKNTTKPSMILEIEVDHPEEEVDLPPFIPIEREITDDPSYSNWALAARV